jgi:hypothetical protein
MFFGYLCHPQPLRNVAKRFLAFHRSRRLCHGFLLESFFSEGEIYQVCHVQSHNLGESRRVETEKGKKIEERKNQCNNQRMMERRATGKESWLSFSSAALRRSMNEVGKEVAG